MIVCRRLERHRCCRRRRRIRSFTLAALACLASVSTALAEDWPTHRHDLARSGVTGETLRPPLATAWVHTSRHHPQPAWHGPARRDGWHKTENLKPRVIFDWAYHVVAASGRVYFGSSADDKVTCLDGKTGKVAWTAFADGPIRLAPTVADGRLYVGSDDGKVYCLDAESGEPIWQCQASPVDYRVAGNERIMSVWPVRSGVAVDGDVAYFSAGLFAFEGAYICAADATTGKLLWSRKTTAFCPQGYILVSPQRLYVPMGGGPPGVFSRQDGRLLYSLGTSGGAFAVLDGDDLLAGPGKTGTMEAYKQGRTDQIASFAGNTIVVKGTMSYLHTDTELSALDRGRYLSLSEERNTLRRRIDALKKRLSTQDQAIRYDPVNAFHIGTYKDDNENHVFKGQIAEVRVWDVARSAEAIRADLSRTLSGKPNGLVGYWSCGDGSGETAGDAVGSSHGKLVNSPTWVDIDATQGGPPSGKALSFDGTTSHVDAGKAGVLRPSNQLTIEAWFRAEQREKWSGIAGPIWDTGSTEAGYGLNLDDKTGVWFAVKVGSGAMVYLSSGPDTVRLNTWHHVAGTYDGRVVRIYLDGELKASRKLVASDATPPEEIAKKIRAREAEIAKIERELPKCVGWKRACKYPYSLILAGEVLYAGGTNEVAAFDAADGKTLWTHEVSGRALDLLVANGRLVVSTDEGVIHAFRAK